MFRNVITFSLFLAVLIFNIGKLEALEQGDIVYRTSKNGDMYGRNNSWHLTRPGHTGIYIGDGYVVEALGWPFVNVGRVEKNLLSQFVDSSEGQIYIGAKTTIDEPDSKRRDNIVQIALDQVGEGYDNDFSCQKGPDCNQWTCVGLTEKAYESADTPDELQYASGTTDCYGSGTRNYALDITPDGIANGTFTTEVEMSEVTLVNKNIFFPYTQYLQSTLKDVIIESNLSVSSNFSHNMGADSSCDNKISRGGRIGPFSIKEINNDSSYYAFYVQPYIIKPDGTTVNFNQILTGLAAGKTRVHTHYLRIPASSELGTFTYGVKITDTNGNLIDDDSFEFTVVSGSTYVSKRSDRRLKRLMRNPETQVVEEEGWKVIIVPERNR